MPLSPREQDVLQRLASGASTSEIADALNISPDTVRTLIQRMMKKLRVRSRFELVAKGVRDGLVH
jgi:DNA-binding CsgD family transcriptional regulator